MSLLGSSVLLLSGTLGCGRAPSDASNSQAFGTASTPPAAGTPLGGGAALFAIEEATIDGIHAAIRSGQTTCPAIVQAYIDRARAYNGVCTSLVTADGADIAPATGYVRAGAPLTFPTRTTKASTIFPDLDQYRGKPLDYGRMEPTISDPSVAAQMGMRVGIPNAGQLNALETLNIRGERSVTCKGAFDAHPVDRTVARRRAGRVRGVSQAARCPGARRRARRAVRPRIPTWRRCRCTASSRRSRIRSTPRTCGPRQTATSRSRWTCRRSTPPSSRGCVRRARSSTRSRSRTSSTPARAIPAGRPRAGRTWWPGGQAISAWSGQACNPYDTERVPRGSSSGSGVAISANLVTIGICEQTVASCQGPASRNGIATLLTTKGVMPDNGGIGNQWFIDRAGIHARTLGRRREGARRGQGSVDRLLRSRAIRSRPSRRRSFRPAVRQLCRGRRDAREQRRSRCRGLRIAILREHMVKPTPNHEAISDQVDREIKTVLRDRLGAELVETITPAYPGRSRRAEPEVHLRRRAVRTVAAADAGDLHAPRRQGRSCCSRCRATTSRRTTT